MFAHDHISNMTSRKRSNFNGGFHEMSKRIYASNVGQCYSNGLGNLSSLGSNKEIQHIHSGIAIL